MVHNSSPVYKIAKIGEHVQLRCNASLVKNINWMKDDTIPLFLWKDRVLDNLPNITLSEKDYSILMLPMSTRYEGLYSCIENGSIITSYWLQIIGKIPLMILFYNVCDKVNQQ